MTAAATRVLFDEPGPRGRARIRIATVVGLLLVAGLAALVLTRGVGANWLVPVLMLAIFLALPVVAISAALYLRAKLRRDRQL